MEIWGCRSGTNKDSSLFEYDTVSTDNFFQTFRTGLFLPSLKYKKGVLDFLDPEDRDSRIFRKVADSYEFTPVHKSEDLTNLET